MIDINQGIIKTVRSLAVKKYRDDEGLFTAEGTKCVRDTWDAFQCRWLICTRAWHDRLATAAMHPKIVLANNQQMARMSQFSNPSDVIAVYEMPQYEIDDEEVNNSLSIVLDNIQDPGNLGTIIRIADWFGIDTIFCSEGTVDAWNPKVVQATMGSIARVHLIYIRCNTKRTKVVMLLSAFRIDIYARVIRRFFITGSYFAKKRATPFLAKKNSHNTNTK